MKVVMMSLLMLLLAGGNAEAKKYKPAPRTAKNIVIAHRGYWNTPGAFENSIKAIDNAMNFGIYGSEFDINFTADDSIVVVHGSKHPVVKDLVIQESTFDKVRNTLLGNGEKVPTLREYLLAGKSDPSTQLILEIKKHPTPERENEIVAKTMAMVEELGLEKRVEYISFSWNICEQIRKADRKAVVYYLNGEKSPAELKKAGMNGLDYSLKVIKKHPVTRISINPQTMQDKTLRTIGRFHTGEDIRRAFAQAREAGFTSINMDVIAGLPGETLEDFASTLTQIREMGPENLTVHTLAIKRSSRLKERLEEYPLPDGETAEAMVRLGAEEAARMGMEPYYMYRQKYMNGNLENVGYARPGTECMYNIDMMEETVSILAHGAGAMTKRVYGGENRVERLPNPKDVPTYFAKLPRLFEGKQALFE